MKILGAAMMDATMRRLLGGPQSMMKMSPLKGAGVKSGLGAPLAKKKSFVTTKQNPLFSPNTGGLGRVKRAI